MVPWIPIGLKMQQEGHSGPESLTCTMCTSHINLCDPHWGPFLPQGHYLNKLGGGALGDATYQISMLFSSPEPLAHGELLWSLNVRRQQLLQMTSPKLL